MSTNIPKVPKSDGLVLSIINARRKPTKIHRSLAHAKAAVTLLRRTTYGKDYGTKTVTYPEARIYTVVDGEWRLLYYIEEGSTVLPWQSL